MLGEGDKIIRLVHEHPKAEAKALLKAWWVWLGWFIGFVTGMIVVFLFIGVLI